MSTIRTDAARSEPASGERIHDPYVKWLWLIVPLAALLRFLYLSRKSVYLDEAISVAYAHMSWHEFSQVLLTRDANMALYYLLLRGVVPFGDSEFWVRLISVIAGVATVPVMYWLGAKLYDRQTGVWAALLLSVNACHVVFSQEARGYALALLLISLSCCLFLKGIQSPFWPTWAGYALVSALAVHSHFYAGLVLVAQWISLFTLPRRMIPAKHLFSAILVAGALVSPAVLFVLRHSPGHIDWVPPISWLEVYHTAVFLAAEGSKLTGDLLLALCLVALSVTARLDWRELHAESGLDRRGLDHGAFNRWRKLSPWFWLLAPMVITAAGSLWTPMFFHRFLIVCLPAFVLLVARGLMQLRPRPVWVPAFLVLSIVTVAQSYSRTREDWRAAVHYALSQAQPGDAIWFYRGYSDTPFAYYQNRISAQNYPQRVWGEDVPALEKQRRLWVVLYPAASPDSASMQSTIGNRYPTLQQAHFRGIHIVLFDVSRAQ
jgi:mannosyltransferase